MAKMSKSNGLKPTAARIVSVLDSAREPLTRDEIAALAAISRPTVSSAVEELDATGLISKTKQGQGTTVGRRPELISLSRDTGVLLTVDISHTAIRLAVADPLGEFISEGSDDRYVEK